MAVQFPNFLQVPIQRPDYSGIGDAVNNYYAGKMMPKDDLIKAVQAQFAQPNAEETLKGSRLTNAQTALNNRKLQLEIQKYAYDLAQQRALEAQLKQALSGGGATQTNAPIAPTGGAIAPNAPATMGTPAPIQYPAGMPQMPPSAVPTLNPKLGQAVAQVMQPAMQNMAIPNMPQGMPQAMQQPAAAAQGGAPAGLPEQLALQQQPEQPHEVVIKKGSPQLVGVDKLYENGDPNVRKFLEGKGFKKTQQIKFDNKTGKTSVITTYPSGTVTVQSTSATGGEEGIPLTNKMISKHQNIVSSIDNAMPIIKEIQDLYDKGSKFQWEAYPRSSGITTGLGLGSVPGFQSASNKYEALVSSVLDSLAGAYGLPATNEGIETVKKQLLIGHGETDAAYRRRLTNLVKDLERRKNYSLNEVKRSNKIQPIGRMGGGDNEYSSNDWEPVDAQQ